MAVFSYMNLSLCIPSEKAFSAEKKPTRGTRYCRLNCWRQEPFRAGSSKKHSGKNVFVCATESTGKAIDSNLDNTALFLEERTVKTEQYSLKVSSSPSSEESSFSDTNDSHPSPKRAAFNYGFQAKFLRKGPTVPGNVLKLAFENFGREWKALRRSYLFGNLEKIDANKVDSGPLGVVSAYLGRGFVLFLRGFDKLLQLYDGLPELKPEEQVTGEKVDERQQALKRLTLSNDAVWEREKSRPPVEAPWWILGPYYVLCLMLDVIFENRPIQRFWFLETVARMPYFSYISMLHLYETLGWWRVGAEVRKVHFAEEWNEMHHLKIMESLGGDLLWLDRFFGQHAAFFYYWILNLMFLISPKVAYNFSELIEMHAVDTYGQFVDENEELLKSLPPPPVAVEYYEGEDLYMYDEFQTSRLPETRRPKINNLYDVFVAIAGDEFEHVKTMAACQQLDAVVVSPHKAKITGM
ncbi:hypothetical protein KP509_34G018300 [Ceratopteris richardii]|uniref:Ubiquinol oxidase n=1 Tax=Ceratopteris richardii TaxID=49495 RepID=A0A8T2QIC6_CERRI|nr:hypothetical protein KP509_34G018300 [Ceratopteris richardii]